jgi:membrane-anchored glycerophosphoryl diester phosphodiesterase (GDPDase)
MSPALQPLTIGQILDRIYRLMRANLRGFVALAAAPMGCFTVVFVAMFAGMFLVMFQGHWPPPATSPATLGSPATLAAMTFVMVFVYLGYMLVFAIYQPAAAYAALQADLGVAVSFHEAYAIAWSKAGRYIGLFLLRLLIIAGPIVGVVLLPAAVALIAATLGGSSAQGALLAVIPLLILVYVGGALYATFMMIRLALANPACVAEDLPARAAIRRSLQLSRHAKGRIFVVALVIYAAIYAATMIGEIVIGFLVAAVAIPMSMAHPSQAAVIAGIVILAVILLVSMLLISSVSSAAYATAFVVLYRDQRLRIDPQPEPGVAA